MSDSSLQVQARLQLHDGQQGIVEAQRLQLLHAIDQCGSINAAAKAVGISYKTAWDWVDTINNLSPQPLVLRSTGGKQGGGTRLTEHGRQMLHSLDRLQRAYDQLLADTSGLLGNPEQLRHSLRMMTMRTSARNQLLGTVVSIQHGAVNSDLLLDIGGADRLYVQITRASAETMALAAGSEVVALIKASWVTLVAGDDNIRSSAQNCLRGEVSQLLPGAVNAEVSLNLDGGRSLTAIVPLPALTQLELAPGSRVQAWINPSHILLAIGL